MSYITIKGFESLSRQQLFDMALSHIRKTGKKSVTGDSDRCIYSGSGCAASVFIKPELRSMADDQEMVSWPALAESGLVPSDNEIFVSELQLCHDGARSEPHLFMKDFEDKMRTLADIYDLHYSSEKPSE